MLEDIEKPIPTLPRSFSRHPTPDSTEEALRTYYRDEPVSFSKQKSQMQSYDGSSQSQMSHSVEEPSLSSPQELLCRSQELHRTQDTEQPSSIAGRKTDKRLYRSTGELYRTQHTEQPSSITRRKADERLYGSVGKLHRAQYTEQQSNSIPGRKPEERYYRSTAELYRCQPTEQPNSTTGLGKGERLYRSTGEPHRGHDTEQQPRPAFRPNLHDLVYGKTEDLPRGTETHTHYTTTHIHYIQPGQRPATSSTPKALNPTHYTSDLPKSQSVENLPFREHHQGLPSVKERDQQVSTTSTVCSIWCGKNQCCCVQLLASSERGNL